MFDANLKLPENSWKVGVIRKALQNKEYNKVVELMIENVCKIVIGQRILNERVLNRNS